MESVLITEMLHPNVLVSVIHVREQPATDWVLQPMGLETRVNRL